MRSQWEANGTANRGGRHGALLTSVLKRLFQAKGFKYRDVARSVGVSEITVKRWMSGRGLTVEQLEVLAEVAGIGLAELTELAVADYDTRLPQITREQEEGLARDSLLSMIFSLLLIGWSAIEIKRECELDEATLVSYLVKLERLKLIELMPGNFVRLSTRRDLRWAKDSPVRGLFRTHVWRYFQEMDFESPDAIWGTETLRLSRRSALRMEQMFAELGRNLRELAEADRAEPSHEKRWYVTLAAARPVEVRFPRATDRG
jgi:transcriptional regulator with XRE-family HTH domain